MELTRQEKFSVGKCQPFKDRSMSKMLTKGSQLRSPKEGKEGSRSVQPNSWPVSVAPGPDTGGRGGEAGQTPVPSTSTLSSRVALASAGGDCPDVTSFQDHHLNRSATSVG